MIKFLKQLFCKHKFSTLKVVPNNADAECVYLERKCFKCGKEIKGWFSVPRFNKYD